MGATAVVLKSWTTQLSYQKCLWKDICSKTLLQNMCNWFWLTAHFPVIMNYLTDTTLSNYHQHTVVSWLRVCFRNHKSMLQCRFILVMCTCLSLENIYKGRQGIASTLLQTVKKNNCHLFSYHSKKRYDIAVQLEIHLNALLNDFITVLEKYIQIFFKAISLQLAICYTILTLM